MRLIKAFAVALSVTVVAAFSPATMAAGEPGSGPNPYSDCGIGAALFPTLPILAVISNVIWDIGTTAVISATASPETCNGKKAEVARFIHDTYDNVIEETAQGEGDHLTAMLDIYGCDREAHGEVLSAIRPEVAELVTAEGYAGQTRLQKAEQYYHVMTQRVDSSFASSCAV